MRSFFYNLALKINRFMYGRYGADRFSNFLLITASVFSLLSFIRVLWFLYFFGLALIVYAIFRIMSRNFAARRKELDVYLKITGKIKGSFSLSKRKWNERKTHKYFKCPKCKANLRVPKGKGKIEVTCAKCGHRFDAKS